jgi:hypothetical protein
MKNCTYCGKEYADDVSVCPIDGKPVRAIGEADPSPERSQQSPEILAAERRFWDRMTFRQFGILIVRLQALWLLFTAAVEAATYLPTFFSISVASHAALSPGDRLRFFLLVLRIIAHVAVAVFLIQRAETVLSWLVKDLVSESLKKDEKDAT